MKILIQLACLFAITVAVFASSPGSKLAKANNNFALKMYKNRVNAAGRWANVFFSPLSMTMATGLVHVGARANTRKQIDDVMEFGDIGNGLYQEFLDFILLMNNPETNYTLRLANRLFSRENYTYLNNSFLQDTKNTLRHH